TCQLEHDAAVDDESGHPAVHATRADAPRTYALTSGAVLFRRPAERSSLKPRPAPPPAPVPGDRVRLARTPGTAPAHQGLAGATGTVLAVAGDRVTVRLDEPYVASGISQR